MINLNISVIHATNNYLRVTSCPAQQISTVCLLGKDV